MSPQRALVLSVVVSGPGFPPGQPEGPSPAPAAVLHSTPSLCRLIYAARGGSKVAKPSASMNGKWQPEGILPRPPHDAFPRVGRSLQPPTTLLPPGVPGHPAAGDTGAHPGVHCPPQSDAHQWSPAGGPHLVLRPQWMQGSLSRSPQVLQYSRRVDNPRGWTGEGGGQASGQRRGRAPCLSFPIDRVGVHDGVWGGNAGLACSPHGVLQVTPQSRSLCPCRPGCAESSPAQPSPAGPPGGAVTPHQPRRPGETLGTPVTLGTPTPLNNPIAFGGSLHLWAPRPSEAPQTLGAPSSPQLLGACQF